MRFRKVIVCGVVLSFLCMYSVVPVKADANAKWNAARGTATVDGAKDDVYANAEVMKLDAVSDGESDGTSALAYAVYDDSAFYILVEVTDSVLDDTNGNVWEKDSVEFRFQNKDQLTQAYAVSETFDGTYASEVKVVKTDVGYNVEYKVPYECKDGESVLFSLQVNASSNGKRNCTLHTNDDLKDAWQNNSVFESLVFNPDTLPQTGIISSYVFYGIGTALVGVGSVLKFRKRIEK